MLPSGSKGCCRRTQQVVRTCRASIALWTGAPDIGRLRPVSGLAGTMRPASSAIDCRWPTGTAVQRKAEAAAATLGRTAKAMGHGTSRSAAGVRHRQKRRNWLQSDWRERERNPWARTARRSPTRKLCRKTPWRFRTDPRRRCFPAGAFVLGHGRPGILQATASQPVRCGCPHGWSSPDRPIWTASR